MMSYTERKKKQRKKTNTTIIVVTYHVLQRFFCCFQIMCMYFSVCESYGCVSNQSLSCNVKRCFRVSAGLDLVWKKSGILSLRVCGNPVFHTTAECFELLKMLNKFCTHIPPPQTHTHTHTHVYTSCAEIH